MAHLERLFESKYECPVPTDSESWFLSTYAFSPAAMWDPHVFGSRLGFQMPGPQLPLAWRVPTTGQAAHPELKTRMLEHTWLQNAPASPFNPNIAGNDEWTGARLWYFNLGYNSAPATLFFDGHIAVAGVAAAMEADTLFRSQNFDAGSTDVETGLWVRTIPVGPWVALGGYYSIAAYDTTVNTSYHIFTTDGILGRDFVSSP